MYFWGKHSFFFFCNCSLKIKLENWNILKNSFSARPYISSDTIYSAKRKQNVAKIRFSICAHIKYLCTKDVIPKAFIVWLEIYFLAAHFGINFSDLKETSYAVIFLWNSYQVIILVHVFIYSYFLEFISYTQDNYILCEAFIREHFSWKDGAKVLTVLISVLMYWCKIKKNKCLIIKHDLLKIILNWSWENLHQNKAIHKKAHKLCFQEIHKQKSFFPKHYLHSIFLIKYIHMNLNLDGKALGKHPFQALIIWKIVCHGRKLKDVRKCSHM